MFPRIENAGLTGSVAIHVGEELFQVPSIPVDKPADLVLDMVLELLESIDSLPFLDHRHACNVHELPVVQPAVAVAIKGIKEIVDVAAAESHPKVRQDAAELRSTDLPSTRFVHALEGAFQVASVLLNEIPNLGSYVVLQPLKAFALLRPRSPVVSVVSTPAFVPHLRHASDPHEFAVVDLSILVPVEGVDEVVHVSIGDLQLEPA
eukprot:scaffold7341_cov229-Pinguiococcus_pyrenoidosus.AAC.10